MIEGKVANQPPRNNLCSKCKKVLGYKATDIRLSGNTFFVFHTLGNPWYIYESKSGNSVMYCSKYCRNKHNHRFNKSK